MKKIIVFFCTIALFSNIHSQTNTAMLKVEILGLQSSKGTVKVKLFNSAKGFDSETPYKEVDLAITGTSANGEFGNLQPGVYAIKLYHDENNNQKMDKHFMGMPKEGIGFSNDAAGKMGPPAFDKAAFEVEGSKINQVMRVKYL